MQLLQIFDFSKTVLLKRKITTIPVNLNHYKKIELLSDKTMYIK